MYVSIDFLQIQLNGKHPQFWTPNRIGQVDEFWNSKKKEYTLRFFLLTPWVGEDTKL